MDSKRSEAIHYRVSRIKSLVNDNLPNLGIKVPVHNFQPFYLGKTVKSTQTNHTALQNSTNPDLNLTNLPFQPLKTSNNESLQNLFLNNFQVLLQQLVDPEILR